MQRDMTREEEAQKIVALFQEHAKDTEVLHGNVTVSDRLKKYCAKQLAITHLELTYKLIRNEFIDNDDQLRHISALIGVINKMH